MGNCLQQPGQLRYRFQCLCVQIHFHLLNSWYRDYSCCRDKVNRAAGRRTVVMVFAEPLRQFYRDGTTPAHLSGLSHQDSFIWTRKLASIYLDFAKTHANPDTDGNFPYHRAVSLNFLQDRQFINYPKIFSLRFIHCQICLNKTAQIFDKIFVQS